MCFFRFCLDIEWNRAESHSHLLEDALKSPPTRTLHHSLRFKSLMIFEEAYRYITRTITRAISKCLRVSPFSVPQQEGSSFHIAVLVVRFNSCQQLVAGCTQLLREDRSNSVVRNIYTCDQCDRKLICTDVLHSGHPRDSSGSDIQTGCKLQTPRNPPKSTACDSSRSGSVLSLASGSSGIDVPGQV